MISNLAMENFSNPITSTNDKNKTTNPKRQKRGKIYNKFKKRFIGVVTAIGITAAAGSTMNANADYNTGQYNSQQSYSQDYNNDQSYGQNSRVYDTRYGEIKIDPVRLRTDTKKVKKRIKESKYVPNGDGTYREVEVSKKVMVDMPVTDLRVKMTFPDNTTKKFTLHDAVEYNQDMPRVRNSKLLDFNGKIFQISLPYYIESKTKERTTKERLVEKQVSGKQIDKDHSVPGSNVMAGLAALAGGHFSNKNGNSNLENAGVAIVAGTATKLATNAIEDHNKNEYNKKTHTIEVLEEYTVVEEVKKTRLKVRYNFVGNNGRTYNKTVTFEGKDVIPNTTLKTNSEYSKQYSEQYHGDLY